MLHAFADGNCLPAVGQGIPADIDSSGATQRCRGNVQGLCRDMQGIYRGYVGI